MGRLEQRKPPASTLFHSATFLVPCAIAAFFFLAASAPAAAPAAQPEQPEKEKAGADCPVTPRLELLSVIPPVMGKNPIWVMDIAWVMGAGDGGWKKPDEFWKTIWVVARGHRGDMVVTGKRLDGTGRLRFQRYGTVPTEKFVVRNAHRIAMVPGGASPEIARQYAFHGGYVLVPSPGCWEMVARLGSAEVRTVHYFKDYSNTQNKPSP